jgi:hypothetical protein
MTSAARCCGTALLVLFLCLTGASAQAAGTLPLAMQAVLIAKLLHYDRALAGDPASIKLLIVYRQTSAEVDQLRDALKVAGLHSESVAADQLASYAGAVQVVYVLPDVPIDPVRDFAEKNHALSIASTALLAENGQVAIALAKGADDRAEIVVHLARVSSEKHELASSLLALARVIR